MPFCYYFRCTRSKGVVIASKSREIRSNGIPTAVSAIEYALYCWRIPCNKTFLAANRSHIEWKNPRAFVACSRLRAPLTSKVNGNGLFDLIDLSVPKRVLPRSMVQPGLAMEQACELGFGIFIDWIKSFN